MAKMSITSGTKNFSSRHDKYRQVQLGLHIVTYGLVIGWPTSSAIEFGRWSAEENIWNIGQCYRIHKSIMFNGKFDPWLMGGNTIIWGRGSSNPWRVGENTSPYPLGYWTTCKISYNDTYSKRGVSQHMQWYVPLVFVFQYSLKIKRKKPTWITEENGYRYNASGCLHIGCFGCAYTSNIFHSAMYSRLRLVKRCVCKPWGWKEKTHPLCCILS